MKAITASSSTVAYRKGGGEGALYHGPALLMLLLLLLLLCCCCCCHDRGTNKLLRKLSLLLHELMNSKYKMHKIIDATFSQI